VAGWVRGLRRRVVRALRTRAAARPAGDAWAPKLELVARRVARGLKRLERAVLPTSAIAAEESVADSGRRVRVTQPLVLITQMGRSGGTLLLHLFDGHPSCLVVPHELSALLTAERLNGAAADVFEVLTPRQLAKWRASGVRVGKEGIAGPRRYAPALDLPPSLVRQLFLASFPESAHSDRDVLDAYFSAYFSAWKDRLDSNEPPRWVIGFEPGAIGDEARMTRYDANYPDGRVISVLRDPWSWFVSARRWSLRFAHVDVALARWRRTVECALAYRERSPDRIALIAFDDLVLDTASVTARLCDFLEIPVSEAMLMPTFNGAPVDDNSSFAGSSGGVSRDPAMKRRAELTDDEAATIDARVGTLWRAALAVLDTEAAV
jgi:hypothetical protein